MLGSQSVPIQSLSTGGVTNDKNMKKKSDAAHMGYWRNVGLQFAVDNYGLG